MSRRDVAIRWTADGDCLLCHGAGLVQCQICTCVRAEPAPGVSERINHITGKPIKSLTHEEHREGCHAAGLPDNGCCGCPGRSEP
jgi:hypothetical protein